MMASSASDQKLQHGETKPQTSEKSPADGASTFSVGSDFKQVEGKASLVRKNGGKEIDLWNSVVTKMTVKYFEQLLTMASKDSNYDMNQFIRAVEYQGFDREFYIKHALTKMSISTFSRFAIIGALRGSNFTKICDTCDGMPQDLISAFQTVGMVKTPKKRTDLTILRNTASIPHWCAYWFLKAGVGKKIATSNCPAELQFPGAASLPMSREVRIQHLSFCHAFSQLLPGGNFNINIYQTAYKNPIPVNVIPNEILAVLKVSSISESYSLTDEDLSPYSKALVQTRR